MTDRKNRRDYDADTSHGQYCSCPNCKKTYGSNSNSGGSRSYGDQVGKTITGEKKCSYCQCVGGHYAGCKRPR